MFDWDGTLFDSTRLIARCIQAACADVGTTVPSDRDASYVIGLGLADALRLAAPGAAAGALSASSASAIAHHYLASLDDIVLFEGTLEMLRRAEGAQPRPGGGHRRRTGAASTTPCAARSLGRLFRRHPHAPTRPPSKPDPLMLHELMRELGSAAERTLDGRRLPATTCSLPPTPAAPASRSASARTAEEEFARFQPLARRPFDRRPRRLAGAVMSRDRAPASVSCRRRRRSACAPPRSWPRRARRSSSTCCTTASRRVPSRCASTAVRSSPI
mgnify:CR=1 FL=1